MMTIDEFSKVSRAWGTKDSTPTASESQSALSIGARDANLGAVAFSRQDVLLFLMGAGTLDGVWMGERHPTHKGLYWWRHSALSALKDPPIDRAKLLALAAEWEDSSTYGGYIPDAREVYKTNAAELRALLGTTP